MPNWKKLIVSGSDATLNSLDITNGLSITGSAGILSGSLTINGPNYAAFTVNNSSASSVQIGTSNTYLTLAAASYIILNKNTLSYQGIKFQTMRKHSLLRSFAKKF